MHLGLHGCIWGCMDASGAAWMHLGAAWMHLGLHGCIWGCMDASGGCMDASGAAWMHMDCINTY